MTLTRTAPRLTLVVVLAGLLLMGLPIEQVRAEERPPETKLVELDTLSEKVEAPGDVTSDELSDTDDDGQPESDEQVGIVQTPAEDDGWVVSEVTEAPIPFSMIGFRGTGEPEVWFRVADEDAWTDWEVVELLEEIDGPDPGTAEEAQAESLQAGNWIGEPHWIGEAAFVQVSVRNGTLDDVDVQVIDSMGLSESLWERASRTVRSLGTPPAAEASTGPPGVITRAQWGANESIRRGSPSYATVKFGVLHHTAGSNNYTKAQAPGVVRGIYSFHVNGNGWNDIGYNFLVDRYGQIYEGRFGGMDRGVVGAHAAGWNSGSFGVSLMGNFDIASPPAAAINAASEVIGWKYAMHGIDPSTNATVRHNNRTIPTLVGHRDVGSTACPGRYVYSQMASIRSKAQSVTSKFLTAWTPVVGDWNGNGVDTVGWFKDGQWRLFAANSSSASATTFSFGQAGDKPVVGDWNGNGRDTVGFVRSGTWHLKMTNDSGSADVTFRYGRAQDWSLVGDWNGDGKDTIGIVRDREWHLKHSLSGGAADRTFIYGRVTKGDIPFVGDWNGDGKDTVGIVRDGDWHLRYSLSAGPGERVFRYGRVTRGDKPFVGNWTGSGTDGVGINRAGAWHLKYTLGGGAADVSFFAF